MTPQTQLEQAGALQRRPRVHGGRSRAMEAARAAVLPASTPSGS